MAGGNRSRTVGISILYARPGGSSHLAGLTAHSATRQPKALLSCDKIKGTGRRAETVVASMHWILHRRMEWRGVVVPTGDPIVRKHLTLHTHTSPGAVLMTSVNTGRVHTKQGITRMARRVRLHPKSHRHNRLAQSAGRPCSTWRALRSATPPFHGPKNPARQRGPWDMAWQNVELATILLDVGSRPGTLSKNFYALSLGKAASHLAGPGWGGGTRR